MKEIYLFVERIPKCFISDDCVQVMIPFTKSITIYDKDTFMWKDIVCRYYTDGSKSAINKYLDDDRRNNFICSNIPLYCSSSGFKKVYYVNQLFEYDTDYWCLVDHFIKDSKEYKMTFNSGYFVHSYLIKDKDDVLLVSQYYDCSVFNRYADSKDDLLKYTVEEIKGFSPVKIEEFKFPRYSHRLNPNIDKEEIKKLKRALRD